MEEVSKSGIFEGGILKGFNVNPLAQKAELAYGLCLQGASILVRTVRQLPSVLIIQTQLEIFRSLGELGGAAREEEMNVHRVSLETTGAKA